MKKGIASILSLVLLLGLSGCGGENSEPAFADRPTRETVHYGHKEPGAPAQPEGQGTDQVEVKDVFADRAVLLDEDRTYYFHIPAVYIPGVNTDEVNKGMYDELYSFIDQYVYQNPDYPYLGDMGYVWAVEKGIVSVVTEVVVGPGDSPNPMYVVYNVDLATGQRVFDDALTEAFGLTPEAFREQVRERLAGQYGTASEETVNNAIAYIDRSGSLAVVAEDADGQRCLLCLDSEVEAAYPKAEPFA